MRPPSGRTERTEEIIARVAQSIKEPIQAGDLSYAVQLVTVSIGIARGRQPAAAGERPVGTGSPVGNGAFVLAMEYFAGTVGP
jgi:hypothetical protein